MRWKCRYIRVLLVRSLTVRIFISAYSMCSSRETIFMRTYEVLVRNDSNSPSISNCATMKPRHTAIFWMFLMHLINVYTLPFLQYSETRRRMFLNIDINKRTPMTFITPAHTVIYLYLGIMWVSRGEKSVPVGFGFLRAVSNFTEWIFVSNQSSVTSASSRRTGQFGIPPNIICRNYLSTRHPIISCSCLALTPRD